MKKLLWLILLLPQLAWGSLLTQVGQFTASTVGATTTVSTSFQPKALILWTAGKTSGTESGPAIFSMGFVDSAGHMESYSWASDDAVATSNAGMAFTAVALRIFTNGTPTTATGGQITGIVYNSNNFVATFNATPSAAWLINFIAIGGSDVTNTFVGTFNTTSSTGVHSVTSAGFQGNMLFTMGSLVPSPTTGTSAGFCFGAAVSTTKRFSLTGMTTDAQNTTANLHAVSRSENTKVVQLIFTDGTQIVAADFNGFTATGFDYNQTKASATAWQFGFLDIQGGQWDVGTGAKPTTATTQTVTGEAFQPSFLMLSTNSTTAFASTTSDEVESIGATDGTNQVFANSTEVSAISTVAKSSSSVAQVLLDRDGTNNPAASFTSFNPDGWTITWNAMGAAKEVGWITAASSSTPPATTGFPVVY